MIDLKDIAFLPIDLPKVEGKENILKGFDLSEKEEFIIPDIGKIWDRKLLLEYKELDDPNHIWTSEALKFFPDLINYIERNLPYQYLQLVRLVRAYMDCPIHHDAYKLRDNIIKYLSEHEPSGYKILINGNRENSFFICKEENSPEKYWHYVHVPEETDVFIIPYTHQHHAATMRETDRLLVGLMGFLNEEEHLSLLERSYEKYKDYCIKISDLK